MNVSCASGSLGVNPFIPGNSAHVFQLGAACTYCCTEREEMGLEEAEYPQPGSPGVHPDPSLEPGRKCKHTSSDYCWCGGKANRPLSQYVLLFRWFQGKHLHQVRGEKCETFCIFSKNFRINCAVEIAGNDPTLTSFLVLQPETPPNAFPTFSNYWLVHWRLAI